MTDLKAAFLGQAASCRTLGSPFMAQLLTILAEDWPSGTPLANKCVGFSGDLGPAGVSLPLRIAGGLHALVLNGDDLSAVYPPNDVPDAALRAEVLSALNRQNAFLTEWIDSPPQTNEIRRSGALIAGAHVVADWSDLPIRLSELGASGGLNLMWDHYALDLGPLGRFGPPEAVVTLAPDWTGPPPPAARPVIAERRGVDLRPQDPTNARDLLRLTAYLWPDQPERLAMTRKAAAIAKAPIDAGDAIDWLEKRLADAPDGQVHLIQNTVAWQYFPPPAQARGLALIEAAGTRATANRPLAWLSMETDGDTTARGGAALTLRLWPGNETRALGRADFHGRWIAWT